MRPTVEEQIMGTCDLLEDVVAPALTDGYASEILRGLISNLRMLSGALPDIPPFLHWDNQATAKLLAEAAEQASPDLGDRIVHAMREPDPDPLDATSLDHRNTRLRELLADVLGSAHLGDDLRGRIMSHLVARASRYPIRFAMPLPGEPRPSDR